MRRTLGLIAVAAVMVVTILRANAASEIVVAIRYLQAEGESHAHLFLYREDGTAAICYGASAYRSGKTPATITIRTERHLTGRSRLAQRIAPWKGLTAARRTLRDLPVPRLEHNAARALAEDEEMGLDALVDRALRAR